MAIFTVGKDENGNTIKYGSKESLERLIFYCCNKAAYIEIANLYRFDVATYVNQMLYLQNCKGKQLNTRALHYILSFNHDEFGEKDKIQEAIRLANWFHCFYFPDFQHITVLHTDKKDRFDVHCVVNPVNVRDLKLYHCSPNEFQEWKKDIAYNLFYIKHNKNLILFENSCIISSSWMIRQTQGNLVCAKLQDLLNGSQLHGIELMAL